MTYDSLLNIPKSTDTDTVWMNWYDNLRKKLGARKADTLFVNAWNATKAGDSAANTVELRNYMRRFGLEITAGFFGKIADFGSSVKGYVGDIATAYKWYIIGMGGILVVSIGGFIYAFATKPKFRQDAIDVGATFATRGANKMVK